VPAKYVTTEQGALHTIIQQSRVEYQATIARAIIEAVDTVGAKPRHTLKEDKDQVFRMLLDKIKEDRGLDFSHYHQDLLKRRVAIRLRATGIATYSEYLRNLINNPAEYDRLFETLCINVSEFFRDPEVWPKVARALRQIIEEKKKNHNPFLCVWSAGCADGEEPYTIAILLKEILGAETADFRIEIAGTDVDEKSLKTAARGVYGKEFIKNVDKALLAKYFEAEGFEFRVKKELRQLVNFYYLDLTSEEHKKNVDIVFCRNVFIYFDRSLQEQLLMKFWRSLKSGGYLVMGKSETLISEAKHIFEEIDLDARLYRKKDTV
jgi:chemotaxis protein methyltransferase CheR